MYTVILAALVAAPAAVSAYGNAIIENKCSSPAYLWSVDIDQQIQHTIEAGDSYAEEYRTPSSGGVSIKFSNAPLSGPYVTSDITQFEYTLAGLIYYDISNINGYPFASGGMALTSSSSSCPSKICLADITKCPNAYNVWNDDSATGACSGESDTTLVLCPNGSGASSAPVVAAPKAPVAAAPKAPAVKAKPVEAKPVEAQPAATSAPAPSPAATHATHMTAVPAAIPVVEAAPDAGVFTTFVTQIITIAVRDAAPEPTAVPLKRDEAAAQMNKRAAHRHHFHRHAEEEQ